MLARLHALARGEGSLVVVEGDGGTGKSTLLAGLVDAARAGGDAVLHGRSWELSTAVPYESLVSAVGRHLRARPPAELARLTTGLPTLGALIEGLELEPPPTVAEAFKVRAQEAFATLVARIAAERPAVLALDDLHWADQASIEVLQYLCLDLPDVPLLVAVAIRSEEVARRPELRHFLAAARRAPWTTHVVLDRLGRAGVDAVIASRLGGDVTPRINELVAARSGGTPLLIHELLDDLLERGAVVHDGFVWRLEGDPGAAPRSAAELIRARLDRVEPHDRAVLEALAVVNAPTDPAVVAAVLGLDVVSVEASLARLRADRLAVETDRDPAAPVAAWTVEHPVVAAAVEAELVDGARRRLHRRVLDVDVRAPIGRRARHALAAGESGDRAATIALLVDAATEALERATPSAAIEPLRGARALLRPEDDPALAHRIERDLGVAHLRQLEIDRALEHLRRAWDRARAAGDVTRCVELLHPLDNAEFRAGRSGVGGEPLDWLRDEAAARGAWPELVELGWVHLSHAGRDRSPADLDRAEATVALVPPGTVLPRAEALREVLAVYRSFARGGASAGERVAQLLEAADRWDGLVEVAQRFVLLAFDAAMLAGDQRLVARCHGAHRAIEQRTGDPPTWRAAMAEGLRSVAEGRLDERPADLRLFGARSRSEVAAAVIAALARRHVDGPARALVGLDEELAAAGVGHERTERLTIALGRVVIGVGTRDERALAAAAIREAAGDEVLAPVAGFAFGGAASLARGLAGGAEELRAAVDELDGMGAGRWLPSAWACLLRARAAASGGEGAAAAGELLRAADLLGALGRCLDAAERTIDAGEADAASADPARLAAAAEVARAAGATWLAERAEAIAPGDRRGSADRAGDGTLTGRELEIADLVAARLTNREIAGRLYISIRTVTSHLDHIYTKLGISSRDALAAWRLANP